MTETPKAPDRIWVQHDTPGHMEEVRDLAIRPVDEVRDVAFWEYIRADLSDAKVAAAYEAAARLIEDGNPDLWEYSTGNRARVVGTRDEGAEYIRALTPTDAQTALDAHVKRAVDEAVVAVWARCLAACDYEKELARECGPHHIPIINGIRDRIAAAIEGGRG